jgi:hypothetical protein
MPISASTTTQQQPTWIETQHKTFTRWCNVILAKGGNPPMNDLVNGFHTGENLVLVMQELAKVQRRYVKDPKMRIQMIENIQTALDIIEKDSNIRIVNIGAQEICDGNLKIILGLIWSLISHFHGIPRGDIKSGQSTARAASTNSTATDKGKGLASNSDFEATRAALQKKLTGSGGSGDSSSSSGSGNARNSSTNNRYGSESGSWDDPWSQGSGSGGSGGNGGNGGNSNYGSGGASSLGQVPQSIVNETPVERHERFHKPFVRQPEYQRPVDLSQKQELVAWINYMTQTQIRNFTSDFSDGYILTRLVQRLQHDYNISPPLRVSTSDSYEMRVKKALTYGKELFSIPYLIDEEDLVLRPDELSTVTYLLCLRSTMEDYNRKSMKRNTMTSDADLARKLQSQFDRESGISSNSRSMPPSPRNQQQQRGYDMPPPPMQQHRVSPPMQHQQRPPSSSSTRPSPQQQHRVNPPPFQHQQQQQQQPVRPSSSSSSSRGSYPTSSSSSSSYSSRHHDDNDTEGDADLARKLQEQFNLEAQKDFESRSGFVPKSQPTTRTSPRASSQSSMNSSSSSISSNRQTRSGYDMPPPPQQQQQRNVQVRRTTPPPQNTYQQRPMMQRPQQQQQQPSYNQGSYQHNYHQQQQQQQQYPEDNGSYHYEEYYSGNHDGDYQHQQQQHVEHGYPDMVPPSQGGYVRSTSSRYYSSSSAPPPQQQQQLQDEWNEFDNPFDLQPPPQRTRQFQPYGNRR